MKFKAVGKGLVGISFFGFLLFSFVAGRMGIPFESSLLTAKEKAFLEEKQVLVFFTGPQCEECTQLENFIAKEEKLGYLIRDKYLCAQVDISTFDGRATRLRYDVNWIPAVLIVDPSGKVVSRIEGVTTLGDFSLFLKGEGTREPEKRLLSSQQQTNHPMTGEFYLQIGVFSTRSRAEEWIAKLEKKGITGVQLTERKGAEKNLFRVILGGEWGEEQALAQKDYLANMGIDSVLKRNQ
jgi:hypothetical protein